MKLFEVVGERALWLFDRALDAWWRWRVRRSGGMMLANERDYGRVPARATPSLPYRRDGELPPANIEVEEAFLGAVVSDPREVLPTFVGRVTQEHFFEQRHRDLWNIAIEYFESGQADPVAIQDAFMRRFNTPDCRTWVASLPEKCSCPASAQYFFEILDEVAQRRRLLSIANELSDAARRDDVKPVMLIENLLDSAAGLVTERAGSLAALEWTPSEPAAGETRFWLADILIASCGNLISVSGLPKTGKSAVVGAAISSTFANPGADTLRFRSSNPNGHALLHFDCEQDRHDHWRSMDCTIRRAGASEKPPWLHSYCLTGLSIAENWRAIHMALVTGQRQHGAVHSVFIDGIGDLISDTNDLHESCDAVARLRSWSMQFEMPIFVVIHTNKFLNKQRGHAGSELERRCESNLTVDRADNVYLLFNEMSRKRPIPRSQAIAFKWSDSDGMFVCVQRPVDRKRTELVELAKVAFGDKQVLRYAELKAGLIENHGWSARTAERKIKDLLAAGIVKRDVAGLLVCHNE
ncbi:MAG TPA: DnaB-like helicase N-terminal domain-containing protein [Verrucomicrobiota bacterium]|nr:DnaB-like helicase N-terminal domain-containing protein [Verrucomicrobiota bacterium]